jgi:hypothetical protein
VGEFEPLLQNGVTVELTITAHNDMIDALDAAVAGINSGSVQEARDIAGSRGADAVTAYEDAAAAQLEALSDLQLAVNDLEEVAGDG